MQEQKDNFYIGWQPKAENVYSRPLRNFALLLAFMLVLVPTLLVLNQRGFADSVFEFGNIKTLEGVLTMTPVPMLKVETGQGIESVLLIGLGKFGAGPTIEKIVQEEGNDLEGKKVRMRGTNIYQDGKKALELTEEEKSLEGIVEEGRTFPIQKNSLGRVVLKGEILDPKCALGVMKPGFGKPHRSCAIRCISGGIPPLLRVTRANGDKVYAIVLGEDGEPINEELIPFVADQVEVCGTLEQQDDWYVLYIGVENGIRRLAHFGISEATASCGN